MTLKLILATICFFLGYNAKHNGLVKLTAFLVFFKKDC